ncbi:MAG: alternate F1F0 ATPase, F1 subunit alpha [Chitinivibrionales bacterium]|nr:alternate F1F0 ATPase, F1 subunit alpha [Chitinivibrionales bacterium]
MQNITGSLSDFSFVPKAREYGQIESISAGIARLSGLPGIQHQELVEFESGITGMAFNLDAEGVSVVILDKGTAVRAGEYAYGTGRTVDIGVGNGVISRVMDPIGRPRDTKGAIRTSKRRPVEKIAPPIMDRSPVTVPVQTGIQVVDALIPVGRGQRELILGDRQTGKTAIALDTIINQKNKDMICIYCAIGQRLSAIARIIRDLQDYGAFEYTTVVAVTEEDAPGLRFLAPYAATAIGEHFMEQGKDALVVYDDLTKHARAYREISLLLRRPPAREAYPGDIFYIHSRLLERATHLREDAGGGSLTALPIVETQAQNVSAYIPTNLISITDGQIYVNPSMFQQGVLPAVDVGKSVSRVGGKTQLPAYRAVASDLRLQYSQFEELEAFSRFGTRLDEETKKALERGRRVREIFKQSQYDPVPVVEQIAVLLSTSEGVFDPVPLDKVGDAKKRIREIAREKFDDLSGKITSGEKLSDDDKKRILEEARKATGDFIEDTKEEENDENEGES